MHAILDYWDKLWAWLLTNATAVIVPITAFYAYLTWRMTRAVARQTRAMIQPVALLEFHWKEKKYYPVSYFEIKNLGTQPLLLLDVTLWCGCGMPQRKGFTKHYTLWDEHIIPPGKSLCPEFDFMGELEQDKLPWSPDALSYSLEVVASDLSRQVVLTYRNIPVLSIVNVDKGMPLSVRWRYFLKPLVRRYYRLLYRFNPPKIRY